MILTEDVKWCFTIRKGTKSKYDNILNTYRGLSLTKTKVYPHYNRATESEKKKIEIYDNENKDEIVKMNDEEFIIEYVNI